jgi:hypothetical protein
VAIAVALTMAVASCAETQPPPSIPTLSYGTPIEAGPKPDPGACQDRIRSDIGAAVRIRASLGFAPGVGATEVAARAAAADPTSDTATIGVPLTLAELAAIRGNGMAFDPWSAVSEWVEAGAPERFGGMWLDGSTVFVTVVNGDPASLALARCVEPPATRYLWADISQAEGTATNDRIGADIRALRASGVAVNMTYYDVKTGLVNVGVTTVTPQIQALMRDRYGPRVVVTQAGPITPL